jgi:hypothetical protein
VQGQQFYPAGLQPRHDKLSLQGKGMNYIIDGHNLISHIPGLDLSMPDDEQHLVALLIRFCQVGKYKVEVYFDGAPIGQAGVVNHGRVQVHFVPQRSSADNAIRKRLHSSKKVANTWVVVSSDRAVQAAAREVHAHVMRAVDFTNLLLTRLAGTSLNPEHPTPSDGELLSEAEVKEWEAIFKQGRKPK